MLMKLFFWICVGFSAIPSILLARYIEKAFIKPLASKLENPILEEEDLPSGLDELMDHPLKPLSEKLSQVACDSLLVACLGIGWSLVALLFGLGGGLSLFFSFLFSGAIIILAIRAIGFQRPIILPSDAPQDIDPENEIIPLLRDRKMFGFSYHKSISKRIIEILSGTSIGALPIRDLMFLQQTVIIATVSAVFYILIIAIGLSSLSEIRRFPGIFLKITAIVGIFYILIVGGHSLFNIILQRLKLILINS